MAAYVEINISKTGMPNVFPAQQPDTCLVSPPTLPTKTITIKEATEANIIVERPARHRRRLVKTSTVRPIYVADMRETDAAYLNQQFTFAAEDTQWQIDTKKLTALGILFHAWNNLRVGRLPYALDPQWPSLYGRPKNVPYRRLPYRTQGFDAPRYEYGYWLWTQDTQKWRFVRETRPASTGAFLPGAKMQYEFSLGYHVANAIAGQDAMIEKQIVGDELTNVLLDNPQEDMRALERQLAEELKGEALALRVVKEASELNAQPCAHCGLSPAKCKCMDQYYEEAYMREEAKKGGYAGPQDNNERNEESARRFRLAKQRYGLTTARAEQYESYDYWTEKLTTLNKAWGYTKRLLDRTANDDAMSAEGRTKRTVELSAKLEAIQLEEWKAGKNREEGTNNFLAVRQRCYAAQALEEMQEIGNRRWPSVMAKFAKPQGEAYTIPASAIVNDRINDINNRAFEQSMDPRKADQALKALRDPKLTELNAQLITARVHNRTGDYVAARRNWQAARRGN